MQLKIKNKQGDIRRVLNITVLEIDGNLADVPIDKTYESWHVYKPKIVMAKLNIESGGLITQRMHCLYKSSKKGYYCVVCKHKAYFSNEEIEQAKDGKNE